MSEEIKVAQRYQWIKSEKTGSVVEVEKEDGEWTCFTGGSRIHTSLITEFLLPLEGDALPLTGDLQTIAQSDTLGHKVIDTPAVDITNKVKDDLISPIAILFNKQKKNVKHKLKIELPIEIPKPDIYTIISGSFDNEEVKDELEKFILGQLDKDKIQDLIHNSIDILIREHYKGV